MGLKVWMPLNGTFKNQGCDSGVTTTQNTASTWETTGKIGGCVTLGIQTINVPSMVNAKQLSVAYWVRVNTATATNWLDPIRWTSTDGSSSTTNRQEFYTNCTLTGVWYAGGSITGKSIEVGKWFHYGIIIDYSTGSAKLYRNGELVGSTTNVNTAHYLTGYFRIGDSGLDISECDLRIYDHILTPNEIKKLSQGLILHLPLSRKGFGMDNIVQNTATPLIAPSQSSYTSRNLVQYRSPSLTAKEILLRACDEGLTLSYDVHCPGIYPDPNISLNRVGCYEGYTIKDNTTGTSKAFYGHHSMNGVATSKNTLGKNNSLNGVSSSATANNPDTSFNGHYSRTIWPKENATVLAFYNNPDNYTVTTGNINVEIRGFVKEESWIKNVHLEFGDKETPWSPHSNDAIYSQMGLDDNIHKDISGYQHNATATGTLTYNTDTPINNLCTHIGATNTKIHISGLNVSGFSNSYSFAWWGKRTSNSPMFWGFSDGCRLNGMYLGNLWNTGDGSNNPLYNIGTTTKVTVPSVNVWHHYVMTGNGTKCYVYLDGELWAEAKTYKSISGTSIYINGWDASTSYTSTNTDIVDFRIYATALDADDVRDLYEKR